MLTRFFQKYNISRDTLVIIACSGGPDSMYLLSEVMKIHSKEHIVVAHFNHCLRAKESDEDEIFLQDFCKKYSLAFENARDNIAEIAQVNKKWIEETARIERYAFFERVREKYITSQNSRSPEKWVPKWTVVNSTENEKRKIWTQSSHFTEIPILTAHHLDDSIETLIFNLIRGAKIHGLTGIKEQNEYILRPFINIPKTEILKRIQKENIPYRLDSTNADDIYLRNHLRLNVIKEFDRINPEYRKNLSSFMQYMRELEAFINTQVEIFLRGESSFGVEDFQILSPFLQREIIRYLYEQANNGTIGLSEGWIAEIIRFIGNKGNYTKKEIGKLYLEKKNGKVYF